MKAGKQRDAGSSRDRINEARRVRRWPRGAPGAPLRRTAGAAVEALERRVLLSKVGPVVDAGDSFYNYTFHEETKLYRATDKVVVGLFPSSARRRARLEAALVSNTGPLVGYTIAQDVGETSVLLERTAGGRAPTLKRLRSRIQGFPNIKYLSPTFFYTDWTRAVAWDQLYVDLKDNVDAASVLGADFSTLTPATGVNAFNATLAQGGGLDVLRVAAELRANPAVEGVEPVLGATLHESFVPTDPIYASTASDSLYTSPVSHHWAADKANRSDARDFPSQ